MDHADLIDRLNEDLQTEYRSLVQYVQHVATMRRPEYKAIAEELKGHLGQELEHAVTLAEQIDFLGGKPATSVPDVRTVTDPKAALRMDLDLEEEQLERYRARVRECEEAGLPDVAEALRPVLQQTQDHVIELRNALER